LVENRRFFDLPVFGATGDTADSGSTMTHLAHMVTGSQVLTHNLRNLTRFVDPFEPWPIDPLSALLGVILLEYHKVLGVRRLDFLDCCATLTV